MVHNLSNLGRFETIPHLFNGHSSNVQVTEPSSPVAPELDWHGARRPCVELRTVPLYATKGTQEEEEWEGAFAILRIFREAVVGIEPLFSHAHSFLAKCTPRPTFLPPPEFLTSCDLAPRHLQDLDFSPFDDCVIASASEDASLKVWNFSSFVDDSGITLSSNVPDSSSVTLSGHTKKVTLARWNPVASDVLLSVSYDSTVRVWDVTKAKEANVVEGHGDIVQHVAWSYNGSTFITTCKDKQVRVCDPRQNKIASQFAGHEGSKGARVTFLGTRPEFATIGFSRQSDRQLWFWDPRDTSKPVHEITIDQVCIPLSGHPHASLANHSEIVSARHLFAAPSSQSPGIRPRAIGRGGLQMESIKRLPAKRHEKTLREVIPDIF